MTGQLFTHYFLTDAGAPRSAAAAERNSGATTALAVR